MKRQLHFSFIVWAAWLFLAVAPRPALAQTGAVVGQADYLNLVYEGEPTNAPQTSLAETAAVDLFSGSISSLTNSPPTLADSPAPVDGHIDSTSSVIGQPVGGVPLAFYLPGMAVLTPANGTVCTSPTNIPLNVQAWQLAFDEHVQSVAFYVTGTNIGTNVLINRHQCQFAARHQQLHGDLDQRPSRLLCHYRRRDGQSRRQHDFHPGQYHGGSRDSGQWPVQPCAYASLFWREAGITVTMPPVRGLYSIHD